MKKKYVHKPLSKKEAEACERFYRQNNELLGQRNCDQVACCMKRELGGTVSVRRVQNHLNERGLLLERKDLAGSRQFKRRDQALIEENRWKRAANR